MSALEIGQQLVNLCKEGKNLEAINSLYSKNVISIEAAAMPGMKRKSRGIDAIRAKNVAWSEANEVHSAAVEGPFPNGKRSFAVQFNYDVTNKQSGQRHTMNEIAVYRVKKGKIASERFFYQT